MPWPNTIRAWRHMSHHLYKVHEDAKVWYHVANVWRIIHIKAIIEKWRHNLMKYKSILWYLPKHLPFFLHKQGTCHFKTCSLKLLLIRWLYVTHHIATFQLSAATRFSFHNSWFQQLVGFDVIGHIFNENIIICWTIIGLGKE